MRKNKLLALGLAALMAASVAGCSTPSASVDDTKAAESGSDNSQSAAAGEKIFRYSNTADIATIDPDKTNSVADATVSYHIYDGLYRNVQGELQPATAESYEVSDDGLVYTFKLRQDTKWSDGQTVTAKDYEYGMKRLCDPAAACPASYLGAVLKNGAKVIKRMIQLTIMYFRSFSRVNPKTMTAGIAIKISRAETAVRLRWAASIWLTS